MSIFASIAALFGYRTSPPAADANAQKKPEHAVIIHFQYGSTDLQPLFALEDRIEEAIAREQVGELDGNEVAADGSNGFLYLYGPDADKLFDAIEPVLQTAVFMRGAEVKRRYGRVGTGAKEVVQTI